MLNYRRCMDEWEREEWRAFEILAAFDEADQSRVLAAWRAITATPRMTPFRRACLRIAIDLHSAPDGRTPYESTT